MIGLLLSGGMDSVSIAWWKRPDIAITVDYGQSASDAEIEAAARVCLELEIRHEIVRADCSSLGSGDMAERPPIAAAPVPEWWPFRNQLILTLAGCGAIRLGVTKLMIGALATDREHADGRPDFIEAISTLMSLQEGGITVAAPAISMSAAELVKISKIPREILAWAHSCHIGNFACGQCRGCVKHYKTCEALGWTPH
jgi:7-cyano-7-deazaguanine synthase